MPRYGIIGYPLTHTFSPAFFSEKFKRENLHDCTYSAFPLENISELRSLVNDHPDLRGLNVTIPYKKEVLRLLDQCNDVVKAIGSCNCIKIENNILTGYNTDVIGFEESLLPLLLPHHTKALILGTGGAAAAVRYVFEKLNIEYLFISRSKKIPNSILYKDLTAAHFSAFTLIINCTPAGMFPHINDCPDIPYEHLNLAHYLFDLIYNPEETLFLKKGKERGAIIKNGSEMLQIQAEESWKIWSSTNLELQCNST